MLQIASERPLAHAMVGDFQGFVTYADATRIEGWAYDAQDPDAHLVVELYEGDDLLSRATANQQASGGAPAEAAGHGFALVFHDTIFPLARHTLRLVFAETGTDLQGSPFLIERDQGPLDTRGLRLFERMVSGQIATANRATELDATIEMLLEQLGDAMTARSRLAPKWSEPLPAISQAQFTDEFRDTLQKMKAAYPPLSLPTSAEPVVSIVIPVYNKFDYTYACLASIAANPPEVPFEVIVVDDLSTDETQLARLVLDDSVRVLRNTTNLGFVRGCNAGAAQAKGEFLFFLNNDTKVAKGFLDALHLTFRLLDNIGVAGSKLIFPNGTLQEAGGIIWRMGDGWNWGRDQDPRHPRYMYLRDVDYVSGAALMIRTTLFRQLNGFDELFAPAYYEDTDLCFRVRQAGLRVVVQPMSEIVHFEGVTSGTSTGSGVKRYQVVNQRKFLKRWEPVLATHRFNGQQPELECERLVTKRALFLDDSVPTTDQDAGSNAAFQHMRSLQRLGYKVTFVPGDNMAKIDPYTEILQGAGIECLYHPYHSSVEDILKRVTPKYDLVYLHRFSNASKYAGLVRLHCPKARIVYNVADLHYLRMERQAEVEGSAELAARAARMKRGELGAMTQVDGVIVHSDHEADVLSRDLSEASIYVVPWTVNTAPLDTSPVERHGIGFIGGYNHVPNVDAAQWLTGEIMPLVERSLPDMTCYLAGSKMPNSLSSLASRTIRPIGWVQSPRDLFGRIRLSVAPLRYGAGIKGKVLDSFAMGVPCVMTSMAAEGIPMPDELRILVADTAEDIAELIVRLHEDVSLLEDLGRHCIAFMKRHYSPDAIDSIMRLVVTA
ncbi:MAG: glycosyltransferase [Alsobacter sp.]